VRDATQNTKERRCGAVRCGACMTASERYPTPLSYASICPMSSWPELGKLTTYSVWNEIPADVHRTRQTWYRFAIPAHIRDSVFHRCDAVLTTTYSTTSQCGTESRISGWIRQAVPACLRWTLDVDSHTCRHQASACIFCEAMMQQAVTGTRPAQSVGHLRLSLIIMHHAS